MKEKILNNKKNGMAMLILVIALYLGAFIGVISAAGSWFLPPAVRGIIIFLCIAWLALG